MLLVSYMQQYFNTSITVLTANQVWKLPVGIHTAESTGAEYWCFYGTVGAGESEINKIKWFSIQLNAKITNTVDKNEVFWASKQTNHFYKWYIH